MKLLRLSPFILLSALLSVVPILALASSSDGLISSVYKYAWGENLGWINCAPVASDNTYNGLHVTDSEVTGYAWSSAAGWINFSPDNGGVINDGAGNLSGYAWSNQKGWINMSGTTISTSTGRFAGVAGTVGSIPGRINFSCTNCSVVTTWRPVITCSSWTYSNWSSCVNNQQSRSVVSASPAGCTGGNPVLTGSCLSTNSGGGGGGGGGSSIIPITPSCTDVSYSDWQACINGFQYRSIIKQTPTGCSITDAQNLATKRACFIPASTTPVVVEPVEPVVSSTTVPENNPKSVDIDSPAYNNWFINDVKRTDIVRDGVIDIFDFNSLMVHWGKVDKDNDANINQDNDVDIFDFNLLMVYWGKSEIK